MRHFGAAHSVLRAKARGGPAVRPFGASHLTPVAPKGPVFNRPLSEGAYSTRPPDLPQPESP